MNKLNVFCLILILTSACGQPPSTTLTTTTSGTSVSGTSNTSSPSSNPTNAPVTSSGGSGDTTVTCKAFATTKWNNDGTGIVATFDNPNDTFTENMTIAASPFTCTRVFSQGAPFSGDSQSLVWSLPAGGQCGAVVNWIQFDTSVCNQVTAVFRNGSGGVVETATYSPAP